jgi:hypothetical protein
MGEQYCCKERRTTTLTFMHTILIHRDIDITLCHFTISKLHWVISKHTYAIVITMWSSYPLLSALCFMFCLFLICVLCPMLPVSILGCPFGFRDYLFGIFKLFFQNILKDNMTWFFEIPWSKSLLLRGWWCCSTFWIQTARLCVTYELWNINSMRGTGWYITIKV